MSEIKPLESSLVPMRLKLARRFYEPVKLEEALTEACRRDPDFDGRVSFETETNLGHGAEKAFHSFLDRLGHVCDSRKGGETVSAAGAVDEFDCVRYFVASNARTSSEQKALSAFLKTLLSIPDGNTASRGWTKTHNFTELLNHIVTFNRPRIRFYARHLNSLITDCLIHLSRQKSEQSTSLDELKDALAALQAFISSSVSEAAKSGAYLDLVAESTEFNVVTHEDSVASTTLVRALYKSFGSGDLAKTLTKLCGGSNHKSVSDWRQLRHLIARLRAYHISAETIGECKSRWPELYENFKITIIPSSHPDANPLKGQRYSVQQVLGRFTSDKTKLTQWRNEAEALQKFDLDSIFRDACDDNSFKPIVHAEILVYSAIRRYLAENPGFNYWRRWRYIGSSKPTCRLCHYYFEAINDDVVVRETHGNLFSKWRSPDCFDAESARQRENILNDIVKKTRLHAVRVIQEKLPRGTRNDSSSFPAVASWLQKDDRGTNSVITELSDALGNVSLTIGERLYANEKAVKGPNVHHAWQREFNERIPETDDDEDEQDGGVQLT